MKNGWLLQHPVLSGLLSFGIVFVSMMGTVIAFALWSISSADCKSVPGDPCDGPAMVFYSMATLAFPAAIAVAFVVSGILTIFLIARYEKT